MTMPVSDGPEALFDRPDIGGTIVFLDPPTDADFYHLFGTPAMAADVTRQANALTAAAADEPDGDEGDEDDEEEDEEQHTGIMVALVPSNDDAGRLVLSGGETKSDLHLTLFFLGEADDMDEDVQQNLLAGISQLAGEGEVTANAFSVNVFNPTGDEPCIVLGVSGDALLSVYEAVERILVNQSIDYSMSHMPWVPHVTLAYLAGTYQVENLENLNVLDVAADRVGPVVFDRLRVAIGGEVQDFDLSSSSGAYSASAYPFHMHGKHDQETHGHGAHSLSEHATPSEHAAAEKLNGGGVPDMKDPGQRAVVLGAHGFTNAHAKGGSPNGVKLEDVPSRENVDRQMQRVTHGYPGEDTPGGAFTRAVAASQPGAPELHRGMRGVEASSIPHEGDVFEIGPTSFSRSKSVRDMFASPLHSDTTATMGHPRVVRITLMSGSRALRVDKIAGAYSWEKEHVTMGRFEVVSRHDHQESMKVFHSKEKHTMDVTDIVIRQVDYHTPKTFADRGTFGFGASAGTDEPDELKAWDDPTLTPFEILQSFENPMMGPPWAGSFTQLAPNHDEMTEEDVTAS